MIINLFIDVDTVLFYGLIFAILTLVLYIFFDINYFLTHVILTVWCKVRRKKVKVDESTDYYSVCLTSDLDLYFEHMNNARYLRELDFARYHFYKRTGIFDYAMQAEGQVLQTACYVRYRRTLNLLTPYRINTKIIYWDDRHIYLEHQFVRLSDTFITTVILCKQVLLKVNVIEMMNTLLGNKDGSSRPEPPPEFDDWIHLNKKSSDRYKK